MGSSSGGDGRGDFLAGAAKWRENRPAVERWEPKPLGFAADGSPILSEADWLKMYALNHEGGDPVPDWLKDFPVPIDQDRVRCVVEYLARIAEQSASDAQPLGSTNDRRADESRTLGEQIRATAVEDQYRGMQMTKWKGELAARFGISPKTVHRHLEGMKPPKK